MGMPIGPGSTHFKSVFTLLVSMQPCWCGGKGRRGSLWGLDDIQRMRGQPPIGYHLLHNAVSSESNIPPLISPNNLPFSSCPNRERQKSLLHLLSLTPTHSFSRLQMGDRGDKSLRKTASSLLLRPSPAD